jgi:hypothetical protein
MVLMMDLLQPVETKKKLAPPTVLLLEIPILKRLALRLYQMGPRRLESLVQMMRTSV